MRHVPEFFHEPHTKLAMRGAGIEDGTFHTLRHTAASWMVQAGRPLAVVKGILGYATMQATLRYAHLQPEHLRDSMSALDDVLGVAEGRLQGVQDGHILDTSLSYPP